MRAGGRRGACCPSPEIPLRWAGSHRALHAEPPRPSARLARQQRIWAKVQARREAQPRPSSPHTSSPTTSNVSIILHHDLPSPIIAVIIVVSHAVPSSVFAEPWVPTSIFRSCTPRSSRMSSDSLCESGEHLWNRTAARKSLRETRRAGGAAEKSRTENMLGLKQSRETERKKGTCNDG